MYYYELHTKVYLLKDIPSVRSNEFISNLVNYSMLEDEYLSKIHNSTGFKGYSVSSLYPIEKDFTYKANNTYEFMIRSYNKEFIQKLREKLDKQKNSYIVVLTTSIKAWKHRFIEELQTYTPVILTLKGNERVDNQKYWTKNRSKKELIEKLESNLRKKYKMQFNENIEDSCMIQDIQVRNNNHCVIFYKGIKMLGNKLNIKINTDEISQKLANLAIVQGLGEKNVSACAGFCKGVYLD